jgi:hypothetical protein
MAALSKFAIVLAVSACGDVQGFSGEVPPLATFQLEVTGDFEAVRTPEATGESLAVALVWGAQWLPEPMCFLPAESPAAEAVIAEGCRDAFGFVPDRSTESIAITPNVPAELSLFDLPAADVLVGDVTSRIAYASLVVYDDRDRDGKLDFARPRGIPNNGGNPPDLVELDDDIVYGASFVAMTEPDVRIALREGAYNDRFAFYPRAGCGEPPLGFSVVAAGGFTREAALAAALTGELPVQDPATCSERALDAATIQIPLRPVPEVAEVRCTGRRADSSVRYRAPPVDMPDFEARTQACAGIPDFGTGTSAGIVQLVVSSHHEEPCKSITHYVLRGCEDDAACALPEWDLTATPPAWWPCTGAR